jgi:hypothetical protein
MAYNTSYILYKGEYYAILVKEHNMSRTFKDRPARVRFPGHYNWNDPRYDDRYNIIEYEYDFYHYQTKEYVGVRTGKVHLKKAGYWPKLKKAKDYEWHWMSTPSHWTRQMMNVPQRAAGRMWERKILKVDEIDSIEPPDVSRKPHIYYW